MTAQHGAPEGQTLGALVHQLSQQIPELIRSEIRLAQAEVTEKGKRAGVGIGMFSVAGLLAFFALATFVTTAILGLTYVVDPWLAALIVGVVLLAAGYFLGLAAVNDVKRRSIGVPQTAESLRDDAAWARQEMREVRRELTARPRGD